MTQAPDERELLAGLMSPHVWSHDVAERIADAIIDAGFSRREAVLREAAFDERFPAISATPATPATPEGWRPTHMHRKGATYRKIGEGFIEATMEEATIYEAVDGRIFVRPTAEFNDGRFSVINYFPAEEV